ncbi:MAG: YihA family ribosome biogenesis GTP-binding protein [Magnetospirillum sp.]|nr:YihA family ribosome biogenesis GTP-binding protein [Magnetospirillum sp.]
MGDHAPRGATALTGAPDSEKAAALIEAGRLLFTREPTFLRGVEQLSALLPFGLPEVAFCGRSNVGKSSLINALLGRSGVARTSNTPGRTQELNFFDLDGRLILVDMPGYGFASAPKEKVERWTRLVMGYLKGRPVLRRVFLLIDSRHGIKDSDNEAMTLMDRAAVVYQLVLTKADKNKAAELDAVIARTQAAIAKRTAAHPVLMVTSAEKGVGLAELRTEIAQLANPERA